MTTNYTTAIADYIARQPIYDRRRRWLHAFIRGLVDTLSTGKITGLEHIPDTAGTLLMMNHASAIDPLICTRVVEKRYVITMAKAETLRNPPVALFNRLWGNFIVQRGTVDRFAINSTIELLKQHQLVLIAPEGTRHKTGLGAPHDGIAYVASKANAWIVPAAIVATDDWNKKVLTLRPAYWEAYFGRAFRFKQPPDGKLTKPYREQMMREAMYQLALTMPDAQAKYRGTFSDIENATTETLEFR
jgi:1-acyl-sn-glycerol-3-phosphate acyltransferase